MLCGVIFIITTLLLKTT